MIWLSTFRGCNAYRLRYVTIPLPISHWRKPAPHELVFLSLESDHWNDLVAFSFIMGGVVDITGCQLFFRGDRHMFRSLQSVHLSHYAEQVIPVRIWLAVFSPKLHVRYRPFFRSAVSVIHVMCLFIFNHPFFALFFCLFFFFYHSFFLLVFLVFNQYYCLGCWERSVKQDSFIYFSLF